MRMNVDSWGQLDSYVRFTCRKNPVKNLRNGKEREAGVHS